MNLNQDKAEQTLLHGISRNVARMFELAAEKYEIVPFVCVFLASDVFNRIHEDGTLFSQAPGYILEVFEEEETRSCKDISVLEEGAPADTEAAYWMGYLFSEWTGTTDETGKDIVKKYSIADIYDSYDVLHTQGIRYAVNFIRDEYVRTPKTEP